MRAAEKLKVKITLNSNNDIEVFDTSTPGSLPEMLPKGIMNMIVKKSRENKWKGLSGHPLHGHSFTLTRDNPNSNFFIGNPTCRISDKIIKFVLKGRLNQLPTGELLDKQNPNAPRHVCPYCNNANTVDSLMHRLNGCVSIRNAMTLRHNSVQNVVLKEIRNKFKVPVKNNSTVRIGNRQLPQRSSTLKPDLWFEYNNEIQIVEFTVPYGDMTTSQGNRVSSLTKCYNDKVQKYSNLLLDIKQTYNKNAYLTVVVVSSLGVIPSKTCNALQKLLSLSKRSLQKLARRIVFEAMRGSYLLFYNILHNSREMITAATDTRVLGDSDREEPSD